MKHWKYEHIETVKHVSDFTNLFHGYQQWLDHKKHMWYRGNFVMDEETGYHEQHTELHDNRHLPGIIIYYIK